jgi:hypothetical protein
MLPGLDAGKANLHLAATQLMHPSPAANMETLGNLLQRRMVLARMPLHTLSRHLM